VLIISLLVSACVRLALFSLRPAEWWRRRFFMVDLCISQKWGEWSGLQTTGSGKVDVLAAWIIV